MPDLNPTGPEADKVIARLRLHGTEYKSHRAALYAACEAALAMGFSRSRVSDLARLPHVHGFEHLEVDGRRWRHGSHGPPARANPADARLQQRP